MQEMQENISEASEVIMDRSQAIRAYKACLTVSKEAMAKGLYLLAGKYRREALELKERFKL
jgi:hypothetical protein